MAFTCRLSAELQDRLESHAKRLGRPMSAVVAAAILEYLDAADARRVRAQVEPPVPPAASVAAIAVVEPAAAPRVLTMPTWPSGWSRQRKREAEREWLKKHGRGGK